jgi:hypothetical protein
MAHWFLWAHMFRFDPIASEENVSHRYVKLKAMHSRFDQFRGAEFGRQLEALIDTRDCYIEFAALSRAGVAAVAAIVDDVREKLSELTTDITARQFCGAMVADVMRRNRHHVARPRGRVSGGLFAYGAVFTPRPVLLSFAERVEQLSATPVFLATGFVPFQSKIGHGAQKALGFHSSSIFATSEFSIVSSTTWSLKCTTTIRRLC